MKRLNNYFIKLQRVLNIRNIKDERKGVEHNILNALSTLSPKQQSIAVTNIVQQLKQNNDLALAKHTTEVLVREETKDILGNISLFNLL